MHFHFTEPSHLLTAFQEARVPEKVQKPRSPEKAHNRHGVQKRLGKGPGPRKGSEAQRRPEEPRGPRRGQEPWKRPGTQKMRQKPRQGSGNPQKAESQKNTLRELARPSIYLNLSLLASPQKAALAHQGVSPLKFRFRV